jgi:hypothetical protein
VLEVDQVAFIVVVIAVVRELVADPSAKRRRG